MAYDYVDQNYEVNSLVQILRCMNELLTSETPEKESIFVFNPDEENKTLEEIFLLSKRQLNEARADLLSSKHYYKVRINHELIELAKKHPKEKFDEARAICQVHFR